MARRIAYAVIGLAVTCWGLTGCLFNTPDSAVRRFVARLKGMHWERMAELVDWPQSSRYVQGVPASNEGEVDAKEEIMKRVAENLTGFPVREKTPAQIRHEFLFLKLAGLKHTEGGESWARLEIEITIDSRVKTVQILVMKINRVWRIVLTDSIFE